jgi:hypothetical protein
MIIIIIIVDKIIVIATEGHVLYTVNECIAISVLEIVGLGNSVFQIYEMASVP